MPGRFKQGGVTLIELVIVLVILGAVSAGIANFVRVSVDGIVGITDRDQLLNASRFALERLRKELERAIPNSVRIAKTSGEHCLQFIPFDWVSVYLALPASQTTNYAATLPIVAPQFIDGTPFVLNPASNVAIVYPLRPEDIYFANDAGTANNARKLRSITACPSGNCSGFVDNTLTLTLDNGFPESSPAERVYFASEAVSFCVVNNNLVRFSGAITSSQPSSLGGSDIIATNVANTLAAGANTISAEDDPFQVFEASRLRNAIVQIRLRFSQNGEQVAFQQEVHIPNAP